MNHPKIKTFTRIAMLEGISYLLLLGIAMPLKYIYQWPWAVKVTGWAHGILFVGYGVQLLLCWIAYRWSFGRVFFYFTASLLPVVPFVVERRLKKEYRVDADKAG